MTDSDRIFNQARELVDRLTPADQAHLLEYLASRIARVVKSGQSAVAASSPAEDTWEEFLRIGEKIAASDSPQMATLTSTLFSMRR